MNIINYVEKLDIAYLESFTKKIETLWGFFFINENNPEYYDANHAHISNIPDHPNNVVEEVISFYRQKEIIPRAYIYHMEHQNSFIEALKEKGFKVEEFVDSIQLWNNIVVEHNHDEEISIEKVTDENYEDAMAIECSIKEFGSREVKAKAFQEEFNHQNYTHFLLRYKGIPCCSACIFEYENQARLESVATLNEFRGKGLVGNLIYYIQKKVKERGIDRLWVFPINEDVKKVYQKYGFETIGTMKTGHAFLGGKSIKEVREC